MSDTPDTVPDPMIDTLMNSESVADVPLEVPEETTEEPAVVPEVPEVDEVVEGTTEVPAEVPVEPEVVEEPAEVPVESEVVEEPAEEPAEVVEPEVVEETDPVQQVASDIRDILAPVSVESEASSELTDDLKQRIAELDFLRECCGDWVGSGRAGKSNFLTAWANKNVSVDSNVNYEDVLGQLEKLPELVRLMAESKITKSNHFKQIESYTLSKPLFNDKSVMEKVEVVEQLVSLLIDRANMKIGNNNIISAVDNFY